MSRHAERNLALLEWYRVNRRELPWRRSRDPWRILVSEVMLQQTQVSRVVPVFERFLERFPQPEDLARASRAEIITAWEDLGYLRRVFHLQGAAQHLTDHGWPAPHELQRLPGVGKYTEAALGSIAFGTQTAAVDTNLKRVLSRWAGEQLDGPELERMAVEALADSPAADWNQAVMDLGATVCRSRDPDCEACPVESWCLDPTVNITIRRQSRFDGSVRQMRAHLLKQLAQEGSLTLDEVASTGLDRDRVQQAAEALAREGSIEIEGGEVRLS